MPNRSTAIVPLGAIAACAAMVMAPAAAVDTPPGISLLYQSDAAYDPATAQRFAEANPRDLLFRVMGPQTPNSMGVADIVGFVGGLGNWTGRLWFSADATKSAFDKGYWGNTYSSSDSYKAYVDYLVTVNGALTAAGKRPFDGIFLECESSHLPKDASHIGRNGQLGQYLASRGTGATLIGVTGSWKQASDFTNLGVDLLPIQAYNFDGGDPPGFTTPSPASAASLATAISGTLVGNYVADRASLTTPGVVVMFSYEPQFFGAQGTAGAVWNAPLFGDFLGGFRSDLATLGVSGSAALGVYDVGVALGAWDGTLVALPEPTAGWLAAVAIACFAARRRWTLKAGVVVAAACLSALPGAVRASDPKPFAYFIDTVTDANISRTPATCAVIGEIGPGTNVGQRGHYTASGRVVGVSAAFYAELNLWTHAVAADPAKGITAQPSLQSIFSGTVDVGSPTARTALARRILDSTLQYPTEIPAPAEAEPTSAGGYVLWAQDFEMSAGGDSPAQMAAAITAISWAARQVSGSGTLFVPVPSSSIQKTASATWQLADVLTSGTMLGQLDLPSTMPSGDRGNLSSMDLLSMLRLVHNGDTNAPLLDGFLAQQYQAGVIGTFPADEVAFYDQTLPYAIMSAHDNPRQLPSTPPVSPYPSYYSGSMPFLAGVYWHQDSIDDASAFDPSAYLRPEQRSLALVVPEPNAAMLLLVGLVGLAGIRPAVTRRTRRPLAVAAVVACALFSAGSASATPFLVASARHQAIVNTISAGGTSTLLSSGNLTSNIARKKVTATICRSPQATRPRPKAGVSRQMVAVT
ncbi:MAG: hypothetical protein EBZ74_10640, partial [Planctomycetia bacterium]|nr:hypothetical protein [Planctomycetia bacterium]